MIRYRLYTERKDKPFIDKMFEVAFNGYTVYEASGKWANVSEQSLVYEIIDHGEGTLDCLKLIATRIKKFNKQQAVLITHETIQGELI